MSDPNLGQRIVDLEREISQLQLSSTGARARLDRASIPNSKLSAASKARASLLGTRQTRPPPEAPSYPRLHSAPDARLSEIHGDRAFGEDPAIICGYGTLEGQPVMIVGQEKGRDTKQKLFRNFGSPSPKAIVRRSASCSSPQSFHRPIITFLDTPGAYPGIDAEERGQAQAIALNLREMARIESPIIVIVIGEGGSGGALALGVGNRVYMLENGFYSVISPEGCAAIIYRDASKGEAAAIAMKIMANDLMELGIIDEIVPEPDGGAHSDHEAAAKLLGEVLQRQLLTPPTIQPKNWFTPATKNSATCASTSTSSPDLLPRVVGDLSRSAHSLVFPGAPLAAFACGVFLQFVPLAFRNLCHVAATFRCLLLGFSGAAPCAFRMRFVAQSLLTELLGFPGTLKFVIPTEGAHSAPQQRGRSTHSAQRTPL